MAREWVVAGCWLFGTIGCGARSGLHVDADDKPPHVTTGPLVMRCELEGDDARVAGIKPDQIATLDGADFVSGDVKSYRWKLHKEDCDAVVQDAQFTLEG